MFVQLMNTLKITKLYNPKGQTSWQVNYISMKLFLKKIGLAWNHSHPFWWAASQLHGIQHGLCSWPSPAGACTRQCLTVMLCCLEFSVNQSESTVGSDCFVEGSSNTNRPRLSGFPSGRGTWLRERKKGKNERGHIKRSYLLFPISWRGRTLPIHHYCS